MYRNTTDFPDRLVAIQLSMILADLGLEPDQLHRLSVKNKSRGRIGGQWGWCFMNAKHIVLIVPRRVPVDGFVYPRKHTRKRLFCRSRSDWFAACLAHECRHLWQSYAWRGSWKLNHTKEANFVLEFDAETYEAEFLRKWKEVTAECRSVSVP